MNTAKIDIILEFATIREKKERGDLNQTPLSRNYYY